ncbi:MAG: lycopene cyclase domain-containing protein [Chitinophagaceae bacterium]|nr:lycopene cyclase domain-containing protein [Chitinophagaceae bacterium]
MSTYFLVLFFSIIVPFIFSFHPKIKFHKKFSAFFLAVLLPATLFIIWDAIFTSKGFWGFNPEHLSCIYYFGLPLEEILFFIVIPFCCIFVYHNCGLFFQKITFPFFRQLALIIALFSFIVGILYFGRMYTTLAFIGLSIVLILIYFDKKFPLEQFMLSYIICQIPFFIVNGILTGSWIENEVVWYNPNEIIGFRLRTIPFEDSFYGMLLMIMVVYIYEKIKPKT